MTLPYAEATRIVGSGSDAVDVADNAAYVNERSEFDQAVLDGRAYSWASLTYDPDAHDTILAVENNSSDYHLKIHKVIASSDTASQAQVFCSSTIGACCSYNALKNRL